MDTVSPNEGIDPETGAPLADERGLSRYLFIIGMGIFITTVAQTKSVAYLPLQIHLKNKLHCNAEQLSNFFLLGTLAWYIKPIFGLIADSVPFMGTKRRHWLLASSLAGAGLWLASGAVAASYTALLIAVLFLNFALVMGSTVTGGLLVDEGQKHGATGRLSSLRIVTDNASGLVMGLVAGYFAKWGMRVTSYFDAALMLLLFISVFFYLKEEPAATRDTEVWNNTKRQLGMLFRSGTMWAAAGFIFLVMVSPGFNTPLLYFQTDTLHFDEIFIAHLGLWAAVPGFAGAAVYAALCKKITLRPMFAVGIALNAISTVLFLYYHDATSAILITMFNAFCAALALIPILDLAARATPKGSGSFGYALILSVYNIAIQSSDKIGSHFYVRYHWDFHQLVWLNAGTTAAVLIFLPFLPKTLMGRRDGDAGA